MISAEHGPHYEGEEHGWDPSETPQETAVCEVPFKCQFNDHPHHELALVTLSNGMMLLESHSPGRWLNVSHWYRAVSNG